jgi:hypothetical protein
LLFKSQTPSHPPSTAADVRTTWRERENEKERERERKKDR